MITNCDIKIDDINRADIIWRPEEYVLREKKKKRQHNSKSDIAYIGVESRYFYQKQEN